MNLNFINFLLLVGVLAWWLRVLWINTNNVLADCMVWHSSIKGKGEKIDCDNNRLCAALYTTDNMTMLLVNVYMPCDNNCHDDDFINILNDVSLLFYRYNPSHVVFDGDMNVDLSRTSPNSGMLTDFITDFIYFLALIYLNQMFHIYLLTVVITLLELITFLFLPYYKKT